MTATLTAGDGDSGFDGVLGIMAKYWEPGKVKTRLGKTIGLQKSAQVHRAFVRHLANTLDTAAARSVFVVAPPAAEREFREEIGGAWTTVRQADGDLGDRMSVWFQQSLANQPFSILIGADCPLLGPAEIADACALLQTHDVVLGPALDGGYYLIGLRGPWREDFQMLWRDIAWSTDQVFRATCRRIESLGLTMAQLQPKEDVDTITELERLRDRLAQASEVTELKLASELALILDHDEHLKG